MSADRRREPLDAHASTHRQPTPRVVSGERRTTPYRRSWEQLSPRQIFECVSLATRDLLIDRYIEIERRYRDAAADSHHEIANLVRLSAERT